MINTVEKAVTIVKILAPLKAIEQMQVAERVCASLCIRMGNKEEALMVANAFHKHIKQLIDIWFDSPGDEGRFYFQADQNN